MMKSSLGWRKRAIQAFAGTPGHRLAACHEHPLCLSIILDTLVRGTDTFWAAQHVHWLAFASNKDHTTIIGKPVFSLKAGWCFLLLWLFVCVFCDRRWGIGLDFRTTEPSRNLFSFFDQEKCVVREGEAARKGEG